MQKEISWKPNEWSAHNCTQTSCYRLYTYTCLRQIAGSTDSITALRPYLLSSDCPICHLIRLVQRWNALTESRIMFLNTEYIPSHVGLKHWIPTPSISAPCNKKWHSNVRAGRNIGLVFFHVLRCCCTLNHEDCFQRNDSHFVLHLSHLRCWSVLVGFANDVTDTTAFRLLRFYRWLVSHAGNGRHEYTSE